MKFFSFFVRARACTSALSATIQTETSNSPRHDTDSEYSLNMVEYAIKVLEDDELFNAGHFFLFFSDTCFRID